MRYLCIIVLLLSMSGWAQVTTYNLNNDAATHGFSLPIPCPSTTGGNCHNSGTQNNQAAIGANSIWAECDFSGSSSYHNPECSGGQLAVSSSAAAGTNSAYVHIIRATDANTINSEVDWGGTLSGGAGDVVWDSTATRVVLSNQAAGNIWPFSFDPNPASSTYMQVSLLYGGFPINAWGSPAFSKITPKLMYILENSSDANLSGLIGTHGVSANEFVIVSYDLTSGSTAPTIANSGIKFIVDFNVCLAGIPAATGGSGVLSVSDDDQTFATDLNGPLFQDSYGNLVVYNQSKGCSMLNTLTGTVTKFGGGTGTIVNANSLTGYTWPPEPYIHETQIFHDGGKVFFQGSANGGNGHSGCVTGNNCDGHNAGGNGVGGENYVWETGVPYSGHAAPTGLNFYPVPAYQGGVVVDGTFSGHSMQGYNIWWNEAALASNNTAAYTSHKYSDVAGQSVQIGPVYNPGGAANCYTSGTHWYCPDFDQHTSAANDINGSDNAPIFSWAYENQSTSSGNNLVPDTPQFPMGDEIHILPMSCYPTCSGVNPWRVTHTYSTPEQTHAASFDDYIAIGSVSPVAVYGQYFVTFTSNWEGQLGCPDGTFATGPWGASCPTNPSVGGKIRFDAFIASVPIAGVAPPTGVTVTGVKMTGVASQ